MAFGLWSHTFITKVSSLDHIIWKHVSSIFASLEYLYFGRIWRILVEAKLISSNYLCFSPFVVYSRIIIVSRWKFCSVSAALECKSLAHSWNGKFKEICDQKLLGGVGWGIPILCFEGDLQCRQAPAEISFQIENDKLSTENLPYRSVDKRGFPLIELQNNTEKMVDTVNNFSIIRIITDLYL